MNVAASAPPSDTALLRAARLGDEAAFKVIADRHGPGMFRYALRLVGGSHDDASEVTQEAFISAWKGLDSFAERSSLRTWLFRLVHRRSVDLVRRRRPVPVEEELLRDAVTASDDPERSAVEAELLEALQRSLDGLPTNQRAVWLLAEIEGMTYAEIAAALDLTPDRVRGQLHRARQNLAERMARWR